MNIPVPREVLVQVLDALRKSLPLMVGWNKDHEKIKREIEALLNAPSEPPIKTEPRELVQVLDALEFYTEPCTSHIDAQLALKDTKSAIDLLRALLKAPPKQTMSPEEVRIQKALKLLDSLEAQGFEKVAPSERKDRTMQEFTFGMKLLNWNRAQQDQPIDIGRELWVADEILKLNAPSEPVDDCSPNHLCKPTGRFFHLPIGEQCDRCGQ